ncbi:hypothetical protein B0H17DRAFT_1047085 [Mycena rosella]|uniref:Uncharacterized protein n=1 Tax=Mycena rosella TaxID=1033263 RepID=A0AAD7DXN8_MYCRO|nr:hypothetical protein B0H17DRAFT_1047085 [Mycena rosella]
MLPGLQRALRGAHLVRDGCRAQNGRVILALVPDDGGLGLRIWGARGRRDHRLIACARLRLGVVFLIDPPGHRLGGHGGLLGRMCDARAQRLQGGQGGQGAPRLEGLGLGVLGRVGRSYGRAHARVWRSDLVGALRRPAVIVRSRWKCWSGDGVGGLGSGNRLRARTLIRVDVTRGATIRVIHLDAWAMDGGAGKELPRVSSS